MDQFAPRSAEDVIATIKAALANEHPLEIGGNLTRQNLGRPVEATAVLSTRSMRGVHFYEPSELVVSLGPGTTMRELGDLLDQNGQELAFEPVDFSRLYGTEPLSGTIGGTVAINSAGPRRLKAGAARDHVLGFTAVSGRGELFQSGGRVMKNVTGYDLSKLMTGSYGTLGVLTDLTLKVLPKAEMEETFVIYGLDDDAAIRVLTEASGLPHEVSSLAHLPAAVVANLPPSFSALSTQTGQQAMTVLRLEGPEVSVTKRKSDMIEHFANLGRTFGTIPPEHSRTFWHLLRDCAPLSDTNADIWRISTAPANGALLVSALDKPHGTVTAYYDWAGGLIWLATTTPATEAATAIRAATAVFGGHATLIRASTINRATAAVFQPQPPALAALTGRIKHSFDPQRILNRGRMREDL